MHKEGRSRALEMGIIELDARFHYTYINSRQLPIIFITKANKRSVPAKQYDRIKSDVSYDMIRERPERQIIVLISYQLGAAGIYPQKGHADPKFEKINEKQK